MYSMSFHGGVTETIIFRGWRVNDAEGMIGSAIGVVLLTALYEGLKSYRQYLYTRRTFTTGKNQQKKSRHARLFSGVHLFQTLLHVIQVVLGYFLMFIFMTYNYWLCIAVGIGTALGYWLFAWEKSSSGNTECCSTRHTMMNNRNAETCCSESNNRRQQYTSTSTCQIIFGWDTFSVATWFLLFVFFCIWCLTFFLAYTSEQEDNNIMNIKVKNAHQ